MGVLATVLYGAQAACPNSCSGHGSCDKFDVCTCYVQERVAQVAKNSAWTEPDCSKKTCPRGISHTQLSKFIPSDKLVFAHAPNSECSDRGVCDGDSGDCVCLAGYTGAACQYAYCSEAAPANGVCQSNSNFALDATYGRMAATTPPTTVFPSEGSTATNGLEFDSGFKEPLIVSYNGAWDSDLMFGMRCDNGFRGPLCDTTTGICNCFDD